MAERTEAVLRARIGTVEQDLEPSGTPDADSAVTVVKTYLEARASGDARRACEQLSEGQQFELVARVTGNFRSSSADQCESFVLEKSSRSSALRPQLARFLSSVLYKRPGKAGSVNVGPVDSRIFLELINEGGTWKDRRPGGGEGKLREGPLPGDGIQQD